MLFRSRRWFELSGEAGVTLLAVTGSEAWAALLERSLLWSGALRGDFTFEPVTLSAILTIRRSPVGFDVFRFGPRSVALDIAGYLPVGSDGRSRLILGFTQDFPMEYVAPDFGINLGLLRAVGPE